MREPAQIMALVRRVGRRIRVQRALEATSTMLVLSGAWLILALLLFKLRHLGPEDLPLVLGAGLFFPLAGLVVSLLRPVRAMTAAQLVDRRLGLKDRIGSALDLARRPDRGPYAEVVLRDAAEKAEAVSAKEALPLRVPRHLGIFAGQLVVAGLLSLLPSVARPSPPAPEPPPPRVRGIEVAPEDLEGIEDFLQDVHQEALDEDLDAVAATAEEFNRLVQELADERLPYQDALDRIAALDQKILKQLAEPDPEAERFLKQIGRDLESSKLTKEAGKALRENALKKARDALREAARRQEREKLDRRRLEELRRALEKAAKRRPPARESEQRRLKRRLKQKRSSSDRQEAAKRRLKKNRRELERLRRDLERQRERRRQLERLQRDLQRAAESLNLEASPELQQLLDQLAEDINRMAREQSTQQQMRSLRERLEELRRLLQQMRRGGKGFKMRLARFNRGARGGLKGGGKSGGVLLQPGGGGGGKALLLKKGGSGGGSKGQQGGRSGDQQGSGIGSSHDPRLRGDETKLKARYTDVQVNPEAGKGPSRAQVIETAADRGFSSRAYEKVHETYERHAESLLEKQEIPPGYRRYIRLYFERIRPR